MLASHIRLEVYCSANVATRAALAQNRVKTLNGSQANDEAKTKIRISVYEIILCY